MSNEQTYSVILIRRSTGESRTISRAPLAWSEGSEFWWTEGNMSCDCNRGKLWGEELACNLGGSAFRVAAAILADGKRVELEAE